MFKILIVGYSTNRGGIESFLLNYCMKFDHKIIQTDFVNMSQDSLANESKLKEMGSIVKINLPSKLRAPIKKREYLNNVILPLLKKYDCVWFNLVSLVDIDLIKTAKKAKVKKIIIHSHNSQNMDNSVSGYFNMVRHYINKCRAYKYATDYWACSIDAMKWMFPRKLFNKVKLIKNAIDINKYSFSQQKRDKIREHYKLEKDFVIGNVARLQYQKNQVFAIEVLKRLLNYIPNSKMVFVGNGEDKEKLIRKVRKMGLQNHVLFVGAKENIDAWYSSFDFFLFPSLFEGLSITSLEAQANGLPILASDTAITIEGKIIDNVRTMSLNNNIDSWVNTIVEMSKMRRKKESDIQEAFKEMGFDINVESKKMMKLLI